MLFLIDASRRFQYAARILRGFLPVGDRVLLVGQELLLGAELLLEVLQSELLLLHVLRVAPVVGVQPVVLDLDDGGHHLLEKMAIVGDEEQCAAEVTEPPLEPRDPGDVEEVGRLVQKEDVGRFQDDAGQRGSVAPSTGQLVHRQFSTLGVETQHRQGGVDLLVVRPSTADLHLLEQLGLAVDEAVHLLLVDVASERRLDLGQFGLHRPDVPEERLELGGDAAIAVELGELGEVADPSTLGDVHRAGVRRDATQEQLQERGLARPVTAGEAHPVSVGETEEHLAENDFLLVPGGDVVHANPAHRDDATGSRRRSGDGKGGHDLSAVAAGGHRRQRLGDLVEGDGAADDGTDRPVLDQGGDLP